MYAQERARGGWPENCGRRYCFGNETRTACSSSAAAPADTLDAADAIVALREEGIHDGIAAFGIPGSHPPKAGIIVPEELELPEGYVRHYQSTDDGEQLPAILMFHPDYEFVNEAGEVVKLPEDGVVRPDMAPPGIDPKQVLVVPGRKGGEPIR